MNLLHTTITNTHPCEGTETKVSEEQLWQPMGIAEALFMLS